MRPLIQFLVKNYFVFLFLLLEGISLFLVVRNNYYHQTVFFNTANAVSGFTYGIYSNITQYFSLRETNRMLAEENARLRSMAQESFIKTDRKVFYVSDTLYRANYEYVAARVINSSSGRKDNYMLLNKGRSHGIRKDMAVISPSGVVGLVSEVTENFCSVKSMLHSRTRISAKIINEKYVGTVIWEGGNYTRGRLIDMPTHAKIEIGDSVVTSGFSTMFPEGLLIGIVEGIGTNEGKNFFDIAVKFSVDFNNISYVYVVRNLMKEEQDRLLREGEDE